MHKYLAAKLTAILITLSTSSSWVEAASAGKTLAEQGNQNGVPPCISCHGEQGQGNASAGYPFLAGQSAQYIEQQLQAFANGKRLSPVMQPFAKSLTESEIKSLAAYFSQLPTPTKAAITELNSEQASVGKKIMLQGKWSAGVPACTQCHGPTGTGIEPNFPNIAGLPAAYVQTQLHAWRKGERNTDPLGLMQAVATGLSEKEIAAISQYLASLKPVADE